MRQNGISTSVCRPRVGPMQEKIRRLCAVGNVTLDGSFYVRGQSIWPPVDFMSMSSPGHCVLNRGDGTMFG
jgi:hypothetical protein